ncbi:STAS domain-containing protein [Kitasatospora sp. NPDC048194]|uniref:STAS domain-containing protein n=1 Tax=Kitasatospora sp. NPDC048194 TaxID=3364045 RepID=UPI003722BB2E
MPPVPAAFEPPPPSTPARFRPTGAPLRRPHSPEARLRRPDLSGHQLPEPRLPEPRLPGLRLVGFDAATGGPVRPDLAVRTWHTENLAVVCALAGDLDVETLAPARSTLDDLVDRHPPLLVVDLGHVDFCDSSGLNLLLRTRLAATAADVGFRLSAPSEAVRRLLELTCADSVFSLHPSLEAALTAPL